MRRFEIHLPGTEEDGFSPIGNITKQIIEQLELERAKIYGEKIASRVSLSLGNKTSVQGPARNFSKGKGKLDELLQRVAVTLDKSKRW